MTHPKKILIFTDWYEPGFKAGGPIQSCQNLVAHLSGTYEFYVFTSDHDLGDIHAYPSIQPNAWVVRANGEKVWYASPNSTSQSFFRTIFLTLKPDTVYFNSMFSWNYMISPMIALLKSNSSARIIIAPRGMLHAGAIGQKTHKKKIFLAAAKALQLMKRVTFHATNQHESKLVSIYFPTNNGIRTIQNIPAADLQPNTQRAKQPGLLKVLYVARIHPHKNLLFALHSLSALPPGCRVQFDIYGSEDDKAYGRTCKQLAEKLNSEQLNIRFCGPLNRIELFPTLRTYHLFYLPTLGENFGHAIFEALSSGCPALISDQTNWNDLQSQNAGWSLPLDKPQAFTQVIQHVCAMNETTFNVHARAARAYAMNYLSAQNLKEQYQNLFG